MRKIQIAILATAAFGICLMVTEGASAFPAADSAAKAYTQTVEGKTAATPVRWGGRGGWGARGVGFRRGVGWRGRGWRGVGLGRGYGWRRWGWRRVGWRRGYYGGWGSGGYGLGLGLGLGYGATGWGGGYGGSCGVRYVSCCGCGC
jgi:hypothetical protein